MSSMNPLSIPGGWSKDKDQKNTASEEKSTNTDSSVPRSAVGTVNDAGDIVNQSGESIGKIPEGKDPKELVGNTVSASGDILNSGGDVLGKATGLNLGNKTNDNNDNDDGDDNASEYTTKAVEEDGSSGFNVVGKAKGALSSLGGSRKGSQAPSQAGVEEQAGSSVPQDTPADDAKEQVEDQTTEAKDEAQGQAEDTQGEAGDNIEGAQGDVDAPKTGDVDAEGKTDEVKDEAENKADDATDAAQETDDVKAPGDEAPTDDLKDKAEDTKENADEVPEDAKDTAEGATADVPTDDVQEKAEDNAEEAQDTAEEKAGEAQDTAEEKTDEAQEQVEGAQEGEVDAPLDFSVLKNTKVNKTGMLVDENGDIIGKVVEGDVKQLLGKQCDEEGNIWDSGGKKVGKGEPLPEAERQDMKKDFAPFENFPDAVVEADGKVTSEGRQVGVLVEGDAKRLKGSKVDEDGDVLDRRGNVVGKAEAWDEPEPEPEVEVDNSILAGKRVNKAGNIVDSNGNIFGRVIEGNASSMVGRMCNKKGEILSESGDVLGKGEVVPEGEREGQKEGPFADLEGCTVAKDGTVVTPSGDIVGRLTSGDGKTLFGRPVDADGDVVDKNGNQLGKAERWEPPEEEKKKGPMTGKKITKEGNVLDDEGNVMGKLINGDPNVCAGKDIDDDGDVLNSKGQTVGHVVLLEDVPPEPEKPEEETPEEKEKRETAEKDKKLAGQLSGSIEQSLEKIRPICKMITDKIDAAERKPKEELDEEELVRNVKPLIEEGGKILTETNGMIRGMDPDGRIQRQAKQKSATRDATPEEYHLADVLKELTGTVTQCIDNAKRKIDGMPHAKKELNPLWGLLSEPLFQILAAVGLLLNGVLGIVGRLLSGLGLGGLVDGLLGSLGLDKILGGLGLGDALGSLTGKRKQK